MVRADTARHLHNRACPAVTRIHTPFVSLLFELLVSQHAPVMRPATNTFSDSPELQQGPGENTRTRPDYLAHCADSFYFS